LTLCVEPYTDLQTAIFNHANLSLPNVDFNSATFGSISETPDVTAGNPRLGEGGPRVIQFGLKLTF
jgi:hypothetical protein